jgi:peptide deformylase
LAIRNVFELGDDVLRKKAKEVKRIDKRIYELLDDMADTLREEGGIGLAATQVGILKRVVVIDVGEGLIELINPVITSTEGEQVFMEGCLSYPGRFGNVERPAKITAKALNREGNEIEIVGEGILAVVICHETDHLDGVLFVDKVEGEIYTAEQLKEIEEETKPEV